MKWLALFLAFCAEAKPASPPWHLLAREWIFAVAEPRLEDCARKTQGVGSVELRVNASGAFMAKASGNKALKECVDSLGKDWKAEKISDGVSVHFTLQADGGPAEDVIGCEPEWHSGRTDAGTGRACRVWLDCALSETCDAEVDGGTCVDTIQSLRRGAARLR